MFHLAADVMAISSVKSGFEYEFLKEEYYV
jgi:hypothetical protein